MVTDNSKRIGLFYGSSTCYTEIAAEKIQAFWGNDVLDVHNIATTPIDAMSDYRFLILGIPTWDYGELQEDWEQIWGELHSINFSDKKIALYGLGDQVGYPEWFQDAMGYLHQVVSEGGATMCGYWPVQGYEFTQSQALTEDQQHFVGLPLDEENEFELSEQRIEAWCRQLQSEFDLAFE